MIHNIQMERYLIPKKIDNQPFTPVYYVKPSEEIDHPHKKQRLNKSAVKHLFEDEASDPEGDDCENEPIENFNATEEYEKDSFLASEEEDDENDEEEEVPTYNKPRTPVKKKIRIWEDSDSDISPKPNIISKPKPVSDFPVVNQSRPPFKTTYTQESSSQIGLNEFEDVPIVADNEWMEDSQQDNDQDMYTEPSYKSQYEPEQTEVTKISFSDSKAAYLSANGHRTRIASIFCQPNAFKDVTPANKPEDHIKTLIRVAQTVEQRSKKIHDLDANQVEIFKNRSIGVFRIR